MRPTSALQRSMIWGEGSRVTHPHSIAPLPLLPTAQAPPHHSIPPAHLADSAQGFLRVLLAAGAILRLAQDILGTRTGFS